jgi:hypothetical protein
LKRKSAKQEDQEEQDAAKGAALIAEINALEKQAGGTDSAALLVRTQALSAKARPFFTEWNGLAYVNLLDDLALFLAEPDPGAKVRETYVQLRFRFFRECAVGGGSWEGPRRKNPDEEFSQTLKETLADPAIKPIADYLEFLQLAVVANHFIFVELKSTDKEGSPDTYRTRDYPRLAKLSAAFLEKYPQSRKREAAMLLHARAVYQSSKEVVMKKYVTWPQGARWEGGYELSFSSQEPFDAKRVAAALDAYDRAFPKGRYAADIRDLRASLALRQREWKTALDLSLAQFDAMDDDSLSIHAGDRLGDLFATLADERYRADVLPVIKANPRARELLQQYLTGDNPLRYMHAWLREQMAAK